MGLRRATFTFIAASMLVTLPAVAVPRAFVSGHGLDTNPCSVTQPCRSFAAALLTLSPNGEVVALDSAGYGTLTIGQPATFVAPLGVHAGISATAGDAVTVNVAVAGAVNLRNLYINSQGASNGINFIAGSELSIEHCVVSGFSSRDILISVTPPAGNAHVKIFDTIVKDSGDSGISADTPLPNNLLVSIDRSHIDGNLSDGIVTDRAEVAVSNSVADSNGTGVHLRGAGRAFGQVGIDSSVVSNNSAIGVYLQTNNQSLVMHNSMIVNIAAYGITGSGKISVDHTSISGCNYATNTNNATMTLSNSLITENGAGVSGLGSTITVSGCTISYNGQGVLTDAMTTVYSTGDNTFTGNSTDVQAPSVLSTLTKK